MNISNIAGTIRKRALRVKLFFFIFFTVGLCGIMIPSTRSVFLHLTPLALLLSITGLAIFHTPGQNRRTLLVFVSIYFASWLIEAAGVNSGFIFGSYTYGQGLGIKIFGTPLIIGINWVLLLYCTFVITDRIRIPVILKIVTASLLMVIYDIIMEQTAPWLDMWRFDEVIVPVRNYISWFIIAFFFHATIRLSNIKIKNELAVTIFSVQLIFFIVLTAFFKITG
ncbi:MAG TPA: carotenoid biosynthesis protein [Bacteroidales bacterium]|nr:carotenoid biosynthesis protein [Bacteroidales bacterium]